jgi:hypothetical protein
MTILFLWLHLHSHSLGPTRQHCPWTHCYMVPYANP